MKMFKIFLLIFLILIINISLFPHDKHVENNNIQTEETQNQSVEMMRNTGRFIGIISFFFLSITIFIGSASRLLGKIVNRGKLLNAHKRFALFTFYILIFHPILILLSDYLDGLLSKDAILSNLGYYPFVLGISAFFLFLLIIFITYFYMKKMKRVIWLNIHRLTIIAIILAGIHIFNYAVLSGPYAQVGILNVFHITGILLIFSGISIRIFYMIKGK